MRNKLSAILLLALFLFNMAGYKVLFYCLQQYADQQMLAALNTETYNDAALITLTIPISLPYQTDWTDYERVDGEITYEGVVYKYVKRKVCNGALVLLCIPDEQRTELASAKDAFYKFTHDLMQKEEKKQTNNKVAEYHPLTDYQSQSISYTLTVSIAYRNKQLQTQPTAKLRTTPHLSPEHPPQADLLT